MIQAENVKILNKCSKRECIKREMKHRAKITVVFSKMFRVQKNYKNRKLISVVVISSPCEQI